ncbi:MAG TPA: histidinol-phosphate transaminase [Bacteroidota bacterium]|nr:histidinol-phosphate transaminase [Bacteroidota bacterium]
MTTYLRPEIESLAEYTLAQHPYRIKLNQNENPFELAGEIKEEILARLSDQKWSRYPPFVPEAQTKALARFIGWDYEGVLIGNGSNELLQLIFMAVLERGKAVVISQPTFTLYAILARGLAADVHNVLMRRDLSFDVNQIIATAKESRASLIMLCSPNNPTGTFLSRSDLCRILDGTDGLVVLDEAYVHFAPESQIELLKKYDKLVILQTFSKAMGAAGLRVGYAAMPPPLARNLNKLKLPYNVNIFSLTALEVFLERWTDIKSWIDVLKKERSRLHARLQEFKGIQVYPSAANFLLMETRRKLPSEIFKGLLERGILIRDVSSYPLLQHAMRVSIGTPPENDAFIDALKEIL